MQAGSHQDPQSLASSTQQLCAAPHTVHPGSSTWLTPTPLPHHPPLLLALTSTWAQSPLGTSEPLTHGYNRANIRGSGAVQPPPVQGAHSLLAPPPQALCSHTVVDAP
jgi:hypothetical protein